MKLSPPQLLFLTFFIALTACSETISQPMAKISPEGTWTLTHLDDKPVSSDPVVTATIAGDKVSIKGPVNRINGALKTGKLGPMMSTRMAGPPPLMKYEQNLLKALEGATIQVTDAGTLTATKAEKVTATFTRKAN